MYSPQILRRLSLLITAHSAANRHQPHPARLALRLVPKPGRSAKQFLCKPPMRLLPPVLASHGLALKQHSLLDGGEVPLGHQGGSFPDDVGEAFLRAQDKPTAQGLGPLQNSER